MGTTAQKLNKILETKEAIRTAINNKGGTLTTTDTFASYPSAIDSLPSGGNDWLKEFLDKSKNASYLFCGSTSARLTTWGYNLTYEILQKALKYETTSNVTNMHCMFISCENLNAIPLIDTSLVTDMGYMFSGCYRLETIDISHMNITSSGNSKSFAYNCGSLTKLIIRNMTTIPALNSDSFGNCYHFTGTVNSNFNPQGLKDGRIYVPDDKVDALKTATNWSAYADIIVPLSTLVE